MDKLDPVGHYCIARSYSTSFAHHTRRPSHKHTHASNNNRVRLLRNVSMQAKHSAAGLAETYFQDF